MPNPYVEVICEICKRPIRRRRDYVRKQRKQTGQDLCRVCILKQQYKTGVRKAPTQAGGGWTGHFRGHHFDSLLELAYIKQCLDNGIEIERCTEKVHYEDETGKSHVYFPDFVVNGKIIEVKPSALVNIDLNRHKHKAAHKKFGKKFLIVTEKDVDILSDDVIRWLHFLGELTFTEKYERKYLERINECTLRRTRQLRKRNADRPTPQPSR